MLLDIKKILFEEIKYEMEEYEQYELIKSKILDIENKISEIESKKMEENFEVVDIPNKPISLIKRYSFFDKWIFKRKEYLLEEKMYKEAEEEYKIKYLEYEKAFNNKERNIVELEKQKEELEKQKEELENQCERMENKGIKAIKEKYEKIKNAKNLKELDLTFFEAMELLEKNDLELVLDENDKEICENESNFDKSEDFILVHKTKYIPINNEIKSNFRSSAKEKYTLILGEEKITFECLQGRNTIHFAVNGEVISHKHGNFDSRKYAILVPHENIKDDKNLVSSSCVDTYFNNKVNISNGYILCPINDVEKIKQINPGVMVVGYKGESVDGFANSFISMLGYKYERSDSGGYWNNSKDAEKYYEFLRQNNLRTEQHDNSFEERRDKIIKYFNGFLGFTKGLIDCKNNGKQYDKIKLLENLLDRRSVWIVEDEHGYINKKANGSGMYNFVNWSKFMDCSNERINDTKKFSLKDIIDIQDFKLETDDPKLYNAYYLFHKLERELNVKIPDNIKKLLILDYKIEDENEFINSIEDENIKNLMKKMKENGFTGEKGTRDIKSILFLGTVIEQVYKEERDISKEDNSDGKIEF